VFSTERTYDDKAIATYNPRLKVGSTLRP